MKVLLGLVKVVWMGILDMIDEEWRSRPASMLWVYGKDFEAGFWWLIPLIIWRRCSLQQKLLEKRMVDGGCLFLTVPCVLQLQCLGFARLFLSQFFFRLILRIPQIGPKR